MDDRRIQKEVDKRWEALLKLEEMSNNEEK